MEEPGHQKRDNMSFESMLEEHEKYNGTCNDRLHVWAAATTNRGSGILGHRKIGEACREHAIGLTMHCAESPQDLETFRATYDMTPMQFCVDAKLTSPQTVLAHMVNLDNLPVDLPILQSYHTSVAHCPTSNLKLASGIAKIPEMLAAGVNVSLGTDGAPCGNTYDMFREMHLAGILHKGNKLDASVIRAEQVLEMATIKGAFALNMEKEIGSLEKGKKADFIVVNPQGLHCAPYDEDEILKGGLHPVTVVVHSCTGRDVEMVVVDGNVLVRDGKLAKQDEKEILGAAKKSIKGIRERSGVKLQNGGTWKYR
jgi:cytosine/adenosine deaminase-related metal-dependent hydrolase